MAEKKIPKIKAQSEQLSDSNTPDEEADPRLCTSEEERQYGMIRGSAQATQAALSHARAQTNQTVERGPPQRPRIKKLPKTKQQKSAPRLRTRKNKCDKHLLCIITIFPFYEYITVYLQFCVCITEH